MIFDVIFDQRCGVGVNDCDNDGVTPIENFTPAPANGALPLECDFCCNVICTPKEQRQQSLKFTAYIYMPPIDLSGVQWPPTFA